MFGKAGTQWCGTVIFDGELGQVTAAAEAEIRALYDAINFVLGKLPSQLTGVLQPNDVGSSFRALKGMLKMAHRTLEAAINAVHVIIRKQGLADITKLDFETQNMVMYAVDIAQVLVPVLGVTIDTARMAYALALLSSDLPIAAGPNNKNVANSFKASNWLRDQSPLGFLDFLPIVSSLFSSTGLTGAETNQAIID